MGGIGEDVEYRLTQAFLTKAVAARTGAEAADILQLCEAFIDIGLTMNLITAARLESNEESAKIYHLRTEDKLPVPAIATRFGYSRKTCHEKIKAQLLIRRAV